MTEMKKTSPAETGEITVEELADLPAGSYLLCDIRDDISFTYGTIPGAVSHPGILREGAEGRLPADKKLVLFCMHGTQSLPLAENLRDMGFDACSLTGGYGLWLKKQLVHEDRSAEIEESLRSKRKFKQRLFTPFVRAIQQYELLKPGDKVAVCISGGKDSMLMAKLFQELKRHRYLCARLRRGYLYNKAKSMGCNKIALGHHFDDVIETTLMGMLWGGQMQGMMPKLHSQNFPGMELIRPMYLIREDDIKAWRDANHLHFIQCACHFTDTCSSCRDDGSPISKRMETKMLIRKLKQTNPYVEANIFNSLSNVSVDTLIAYKQNGKVHHFLETYE